MFNTLKEEAVYAIRSNRASLVHECYGAAMMAHALNAISDNEYRRLNKALVIKWMNVGEKKREEYAHEIQEEDI